MLPAGRNRGRIGVRDRDLPAAAGIAGAHMAISRSLAVLPPLLALAACLSAPQPQEPPPAAETLTYWCGDGGSLGLRMRPGGVHVTGAEAHGIDLPAVPPGQNRSYASAPYGLVVEGGDVVFSKQGRPPLACTR